MDADGNPTTFLEFRILVLFYLRVTALPHKIYRMSDIEQDVLRYRRSPCPMYRYLKKLTMVGVLVKRSTFGMNTFYAIHRQRLHELLWKQEVLRCAYALLWEGAEIVEPEPLPLEQLEDFLQQYGMAIDRRKEQIVVLQSDGGS